MSFPLPRMRRRDVLCPAQARTATRTTRTWMLGSPSLTASRTSPSSSSRPCTAAATPAWRTSWRSWGAWLGQAMRVQGQGLGLGRGYGFRAMLWLASPLQPCLKPIVL